MKNVTSIIFTLLLLTTAFSTLANEDETETNQADQNIAAACRPMPLCEQDVTGTSDTYVQWVDLLTMQQLMELLKIQQAPSTQAAKTNDD